MIIGPGVPALKQTNRGGWFNLPKSFHFSGPYLVLVVKPGYQMGLEFVAYQGEPLQMTVEMTKQ